MKSDFFYSKSTKLYISRKPLTIDSRVKKAAEKENLSLDWDDEGRINNINFDDSRKLLSALDSRMLTPVEYWKVMSDAISESDKDMISELMSDEYVEWLNRVYFKDKKYIDNPKILGKYKYSGIIKQGNPPDARPGWFTPENNISKIGEPIHIELNRDKFASSWKYWEANVEVIPIKCTAPIRGYVTSVGKPSCDLGIPPDSRQPKQMIRECRKKLLNSIIDEKILFEINELLLKKDKTKIVDFVRKYGKLFSKSYDSSVYKIRERLFDFLGEISLEKNISKEISKISSLSNNTLTYKAIYNFLKNTKTNLNLAIENKKDVVFVMGHKNPDTDTVICSIFEAYRNHILNGNNICYIPIVQSKKLPDEIKVLLGELSDFILFTNNALYTKAKKEGISRWISVDQNREVDVQKYFISIIDHHLICQEAKNRDIPKTTEMVGSASSLIAYKFLGMGVIFSKDVAKLIYSATLMDTEKRVKHKMTPKDKKIMDYLKKISEVENDSVLYSNLMGHLLATTDVDLLFYRDYKEDWGFGYAEIKVKSMFDSQGKVIKSKSISRLLKLSRKNTDSKNIPFTLLKITDYLSDNITVNRERIYLLFNKNANSSFKKSIIYTIKSIIEFEFPKDHCISNTNYVDFWGSGLQLSRKKTAPVLEPIVKSYNRYFYSPTIKKYVKRDFLKNTQEVKSKVKGLSTDKQNRINNITFKEVKQIIPQLNISILSLPEYFKVLKDAKKINDILMIDSLQGSNFVEFLDSAIVDYKFLINHPNIENGKALGKMIKVNVPEGKPGLVHPETISLETGIPKTVRPPNEYGNKELWRYWYPDSNLVFPCRSYIFLLMQPCWDGKFHLNDSFPNLGIRPVVNKVIDPVLKIKITKENLIVDLFLEQENHIYKWPKKISDYEKLINK